MISRRKFGERAVNRAVTFQFAREQFEGLDGEWRSDEIPLTAQPLSHSILRRRSTTRDGDVGMKGAEIDVDGSGEERVIDLLTKLMQSRVARSESDPNNVRCASRGKRADAFDRKQKWFDANRRETIDERNDIFLRHIAKKSQRHMELFNGCPADVV